MYTLAYSVCKVTNIVDRRDIRATLQSMLTVKPEAYMDLFHPQYLKYIRKICSPVIFLAVVVLFTVDVTTPLHLCPAYISSNIHYRVLCLM